MIIRTDQLTDLTSSITEPVTTDYAKEHLRVDIADDDTLIGNLITGAREHCEIHCNRSFVPHTYRADLPGFSYVWQLPMHPVQSIASIKYYDTASPQVLQTWASTNYRLVHNCIERVDGASFPSHSIRSDAVQITFVTGWRDQSSPQGVGADCPEAVKSAILMLVGSAYENREHFTLYPGQLIEIPTVQMLINPYRVYR